MISMPLSKARPLSPRICNSERTDSTSEPISTQRGQFFRRWAASQTRKTSNRIRPAAVKVAVVTIESVMSGAGVRSWNATDNASSVSDRYINASNHTTFLGTFMGRRLFLGKFKSHFAVTVGVIAPVFAHFYKQEKVHRVAHDFRQFLARVRADRLDRGAALAEHDLALALALDKNRLLDADRLVLALGPAIGLDGRLIRQLLMQ